MKKVLGVAYMPEDLAGRNFVLSETIFLNSDCLLSNLECGFTF